MSTDEKYGLRSLAAGIIRESPHSDPGSLALELVNSIDPEHYEEAVLKMARAYMQSLIGQIRAQANGGVPRSGSLKVAAVRDAWRRALDVPEYIPSADAWVRLREATREQVMEMAAHRMQKAHENASAAKRYQRIADHMRRLNVANVGDLPEDVLRESVEPQGVAA